MTWHGSPGINWLAFRLPQHVSGLLSHYCCLYVVVLKHSGPERITSACLSRVKKKKKKSTFRRSWRALNVCRWRVPTNHAPICLEKREVVPPLSPRACWVTPPKEGFIKKMSHYSLQSGSALRKRGCETLMKKRNALDHWLKPYGVSKFTTNNITLILCVVSAILLVCYQWDNSKLSSLFLAKSRIKNKHISSKGK